MKSELGWDNKQAQGGDNKRRSEEGWCKGEPSPEAALGL